MRLVRTTLAFCGLALGFAVARPAQAQQPYPQQPYPPQQQPYPQQPYPPQQQPYPQQPYPPQQQPYPQQPYPPQQQPYPQQPYPQQPYPQQGYQPYPAQPGYSPYQPAPTNKRSADEMTFLYITGGLYGVGSGIWLDALFKAKDPGLAVIAPIGLGAAVPIGVYFWDAYGGPLHRGVPSSIATGLGLGAIEGMAVAGTQWQYERGDNKDWSFKTQTTVTWIMSTGGGVGGWAFGEWIEPDPRSMGFIVGGSAWGAASGTAIGVAASGRDWKDGASIAGLIGYNVGLVGAGALSIISTPSWTSQKYMWLGYALGALAGCLVFPVYLFSDADAKHGFIGPGIGGLAGVGVAGALTWNMKDADDVPHAKAYVPPVQVGLAPAPALTPITGATSYAQRSVEHMVGPSGYGVTPGGATLQLSGTF